MTEIDSSTPARVAWQHILSAGGISAANAEHLALTAEEGAAAVYVRSTTTGFEFCAETDARAVRFNLNDDLSDTERDAVHLSSQAFDWAANGGERLPEGEEEIAPDNERRTMTIAEYLAFRENNVQVFALAYGITTEQAELLYFNGEVVCSTRSRTDLERIRTNRETFVNNAVAEYGRLPETQGTPRPAFVDWLINTYLHIPTPETNPLAQNLRDYAIRSGEEAPQPRDVANQVFVNMLASQCERQGSYEALALEHELDGATPYVGDFSLTTIQDWCSGRVVENAAPAPDAPDAPEAPEAEPPVAGSAPANRPAPPTEGAPAPESQPQEISFPDGSFNDLGQQYSVSAQRLETFLLAHPGVRLQIGEYTVWQGHYLSIRRGIDWVIGPDGTTRVQALQALLQLASGPDTTGARTPAERNYQVSRAAQFLAEQFPADITVAAGDTIVFGRVVDAVDQTGARPVMRNDDARITTYATALRTEGTIVHQPAPAPVSAEPEAPAEPSSDVAPSEEAAVPPTLDERFDLVDTALETEPSNIMEARHQLEEIDVATRDQIPQPSNHRWRYENMMELLAAKELLAALPPEDARRNSLEAALQAYENSTGATNIARARAELAQTRRRILIDYARELEFPSLRREGQGMLGNLDMARRAYNVRRWHERREHSPERINRAWQRERAYRHEMRAAEARLLAGIAAAQPD